MFYYLYILFKKDKISKINKQEKVLSLKKSIDMQFIIYFSVNQKYVKLLQNWVTSFNKTIIILATWYCINLNFIFF